jgi:hypothetical protein
MRKGELSIGEWYFIGATKGLFGYEIDVRYIE